MEIRFTKIRRSHKSAHQWVEVNGVVAGEIWRELIWVRSDGHGDRLWRWFAKAPQLPGTLGHGMRLPSMNGAGFVSKEKAADALAAVWLQDGTQGHHCAAA
jgi:hypothetical protein